LKLSILGRAFSGKKTIANKLAEQFGSDKITIFRMDSIICEALDYIAPKKVEEASSPDPKGKGKKGKDKEEVVVTDPFEGKDTAAYKEFA
jgi:hypothetical protein